MATQYSPKISTDGLVLCLDAANPESYPGSGTTWYDLSGNGNHGTLVNGPTFDGGNNGSIVFDGLNDYVNFNKTFSFINSSFTLEFAGSINGLLDSSNRRSIFFGGFPGEISSNYVFFTRVFLDDALFYVNFGGGTDPYRVPTFTPFIWTFVFDASVMKGRFAVNGLLNPYDNDDFSIYNKVQFNWYRFGNTLRPYIGNLYYTKIYNRALTPSEITQNYNSLKSRFNI